MSVSLKLPVHAPVHPPVDLPTFEQDLTLGKPLPARVYHDPEILAAERSRIFARTWQPVGNLSDLAEPGSYVTAEVAGEPIVVIRGEDDVLRAFYNVCQHRAGPVADGKGKRRSLTCRYHGWTYATYGRLLLTPELEGIRDFDKACHGLVPVAVDTFGPFVFVNLDTKAEPLASVLGAIPEETAKFDLSSYRPLAKRDYEVNCNWKIYIDNYLEGYHLPSIHPALYRELDYSRYRIDTFRLYSSQYAPIRPAKADATSQTRLYSEEDGGALYYWVFPNWMINIYPDNLSINIVVPLSVDRTLTIFEWFVKDLEAPKERVEASMAFSHQIQLEDIAICEVVQKRIGSRGYERGGRFNPKRENGVHHFQSLVHAHLTE